MRKRTYPVERTFNPIIQIKNQNIMATFFDKQSGKADHFPVAAFTTVSR